MSSSDQHIPGSGSLENQGGPHFEGRFGSTRDRIDEFRAQQEAANGMNQDTLDIDPSWEKPILDAPPSGGILRTILSLLLFIGVFYFIIPDPWIVGFVVVVLFIHEAGHLAAMKAFGFRDLRMLFVPLLGALALGKKELVKQSERVIILLAGPVPGILLGLPLLVFGPREPIDFHSLGLVFVILNLFNLLPITPLDGGRLIETLFFSRSSTLKRGFLLVSAIGMLVVIWVTQNWPLIILPAAILLRFPGEIRLDKLRKRLQEEERWAERSYESLSTEEYWDLRPIVIDSFSKKTASDLRNKPTASNERTIALQMQGALVPPLQLDMSQGMRLITVIAWLFFLTLPFVVTLLSLLPRYFGN